MAKPANRKNAANPFAQRMEKFRNILLERKLDAAVTGVRASIRALTGVDCDSALLVIPASVIYFILT